MKTVDRIKILRIMQIETIKDYQKTKIRTRKGRLAEEIIKREKTINNLIKQLDVWD